MTFLNRLLRAVTTAATLAITALVILQALDRHVHATSFDAYEHLARVGLVWLVFIGYAQGVQEHANLRVLLWQNVLPRRLLLARQVVFDGAMLALALVLLVKSGPVYEVGRTQQIMGTPFSYAVIYLALMAGMAVLALVLAVRIVAVVSGRLGPEDVAEANAP